MLDARAEDVARNRFAQIEEYHGARKHAREQDPVANDYQPLKPDRLYLTPEQFAGDAGAAAFWRDCSRSRPRRSARDVIDCGGRRGRDFAPERLDENAMCSQRRAAHIKALREAGKTGRRRRLDRRLARAAAGMCSPSMG